MFGPVKFVLAMVMVVVLAGVAQAQQTRTLKNANVVVRLCPNECVAVNGHSLKPGGTAKVFETRAGWARVSGYLKRENLVPAFGDKVPAKPALWVATSALVSANAAAAKPKAEPKPAAKTQRPKRVDVVTAVARLRNPVLPKFRPGTSFAQRVPVAEEPSPVVTEPAIAETAPAVEAPVPTVVEEVVRAPAAPQPAPSGGSGKALTWEELQARIKRQREEAGVTASAPAAPAVDEEELARRRAAEAEQAAERRREAAAKRAREAEAARVAEVQRQEQARVAQAAQAEREAAAARAAAEANRAERARVAEAARREQEAAAARKAASQPAPKSVKVGGSVGYTPPQADAPAPDAPAPAAVAKPALPEPAKPEPKPQEVAAVVLPKAVVPTAPAVEEPKFRGPEPTYESANSQPIAFGSRPKKLTKALLDKRLSKLPGPKSKVRKDVVIALRHYALGLLKGGECKGIARGGASAAPGMLYIACSDDPTYLRQFPLEEESW